MNPPLSFINRALESCGTRSSDRIPAEAEPVRERGEDIHARALKLVEQCMERALGSYTVYSEDSVAGFWGKIGCLFEGILDELQNGGPDSILLDDRLMSAHSLCEEAAGNTETDDLFWKNATRKIDTLREENGPQAERALKEEKALKAAK